LGQKKKVILIFRTKNYNFLFSLVAAISQPQLFTTRCS